MRKKKRRFRHLLHKHLNLLHRNSKLEIKNTLMELEDIYKDSYNLQDRFIEYRECLEFFKLAKDFDLEDDIVEIIIAKYYITHTLDTAYLSKKPLKEGRDNKGVYVGSGSGGYRGNTVRYPKKNRSRKTWAKFYSLFPSLAEKDGWDGKSSKRMK